MITNRSRRISLSQSLYLLFKDHDTYHAHYESHLQIINQLRKSYLLPTNSNRTQQHMNEVIQIMLYIKNLISSESSDPYSKLLALRFIKDALSFGSYTVYILVCVTIVKQAYKQIENITRYSKGQNLFVDFQSNQGNIHSEQYLMKIGVSFRLIVLEMITTLTKQLPLWTFNETSFSKLKSLPTLLYQQIALQRKIQIPSDTLYYKQKHVDKIRMRIEELEGETLREQVNDFYHLMMQKIFKFKNVEVLYEDVLMDCMLGGDMNWSWRIDQMIKDYLSKCLDDEHVLSQGTPIVSSRLSSHQTQQTIAINLCHKMFMTANIQVLCFIQNTLLVSILYNYISKGRIYHNKKLLYLWGKIIKSNNYYIDLLNILLQVSHSLAICDMIVSPSQLIYFGQKYEDIEAKFLQNGQKFRQRNLMLANQMRSYVYLKDREKNIRRNIQSLMGSFMKKNQNQASYNKPPPSKSNLPHIYTPQRKPFQTQESQKKQISFLKMDLDHSLVSLNDSRISPKNILLGIESKQQINFVEEQDRNKSPERKDNKLLRPEPPTRYFSIDQKNDNSRGRSSSSRRSRGKGLTLSCNLSKQKQQITANKIVPTVLSNPVIYDQGYYDKIFKMQRELIETRKKQLNLSSPRNYQPKKLNFSNYQFYPSGSETGKLQPFPQGSQTQQYYDKIFLMQRQLIETKRKQLSLQSPKNYRPKKLNFSNFTNCQIHPNQAPQVCSQQVQTETPKKLLEFSHQTQIFLKSSQKKIKQKASPRSKTSKMFAQREGSPLRTKLAKSYHKIMNKIFTFSGNREKREILKNKSLLLKNQDLEIGQITKITGKEGSSCERNQPAVLNVLIYVTALKQIQSLSLNLVADQNSNSWVSVASQKNNRARNLGATQQYGCKFALKSSSYLYEQMNDESYLSHQILRSLNSPIVLKGSYISKTSCQEEPISIKLPIFITKLTENVIMPSDKKTSEKILQLQQSQKDCPLNSFLNIDTKTFRGFDDFLKFFPFAFQLNSRTFITELRLPTGKNVVLVVTLLCKNEIEINFLFENQIQARNANLIETLIFKGYCSLLGL